MEKKSYEDLVCLIRRRAKNTRLFAQLSIFIIIFVVFMMVIYFSASTNLSQFGKFTVSFEDTPFNSEKPVSAKESPAQAFGKIERKITALEKNIENNSNFAASAAISIGLTIIRIASVFLAIYLVQILVGFTRYQFRIADHLEATADSFEFSKGNIESMSKTLTAISPQHIEFGKMPKPPTEKSIDLIKDLVSKIPKS